MKRAMILLALLTQAGGCGDGGTPAPVPSTCMALGAECGDVADGAGGVLHCGACTAPMTCGGGGTANHCGCTPRSCAAQNKTCGTLDDGCGHALDCGACAAPM